MEANEAEQLIEKYDALVTRALAIADGAPYFEFVGEPGYAKIELVAGECVLSWPETGMEWDMPTLETNILRFPERLLFLSEDELAEWKRAEAAKYEQRQRESAAARRREQEEAERAQYERLAAKYGPPSSTG